MAFEKVGVEAIVKNVSAFIKDTEKINRGLQSLRPNATLIQKTFGFLTDSINSFGESLVRVAEVALGVLLRDAIRAAVDLVQELGRQIFEAGDAFQTLEIRLKRLNFNDIIEQQGHVNDAMKSAIRLTQDQMDWLIKVGALTPYDPEDIANVFTMARSYGFAADEAKKLTQDISDFASGMGLSNVEMNRIIVNFGQMVQQGKVTQREMNDLARGAFVPVNDILDMMKEKTGLAGDEFDNFRNSTEGVNLFMETFSELVGTRFSGASEELARTFGAASRNVKEIITSLLGMHVVKPVFDVLGTAIAKLTDQFTRDPEKWDALVKAAKNLGAALSSTIRTLLSSRVQGIQDLPDLIIDGLNRMAEWIRNNKADFFRFFDNIGKTIRDKLLPWITDSLIPQMIAFARWLFENRDVFIGFFEAIGRIIVEKVLPAIERLSDWVMENQELINQFFETLGRIVTEVFEGLLGIELGDMGFLEALEKFMQFVIDNEDSITTFSVAISKAWVAMQILGTVLNIVGGILIGFGGWILGVAASVSGFIGLVQVLGGLLTLQLVAGIALAVENIQGLIGAFNNVKESLNEFTERWKERWEEILQAVEEKDWFELGRLVIDGITDAIALGIEALIQLFTSSLPTRIRQAVRSVDWFSIGKIIAEEVFLGVWTLIPKTKELLNSLSNSRGGGGTASGGGSFIGGRTQSATAAPSVTNTVTNNNNQRFNMTVNTQARSSSVIQDFNLLQSLVE